ncbi:MAG: MFS transporter, partial [Alphaproteobacteria bacterium]|nr:MFS transporter [Alphaproteobacteria bacterium]
MRDQPLAIWRLIAYGAPALPLAALTLPAYVYLPRFYAQDVGLGLAVVGLVLLFARIWDVLTDPLIGVLSDRTPVRLGRRRTWVLVGTPLVMVAVWYLLVPAPGAGWPYLLGWSLVLYLGWTMVILPLTAWGAELSGNYHERTRIAGFREGAVLLGTLVVLALPPLLGLGDADE